MPTVKRNTPSSFTPNRTPSSGTRTSLTQTEVAEYVAMRKAELAAKRAAEDAALAAELAALAPVRHLHDQDITVGQTLGVRVNNRIVLGVVTDRAPRELAKSWLYVVEVLQPTPGPTGRIVKNLTPRTNKDLYPASAVGRGAVDEAPESGA